VTRLIAVEFFKLRKRMMTWIVALLLVGLVVLLYSVLWSVSGRVTTFGPENQFTGEELRRALFLQTSVPFSLSIVSSFGIILAAVLAAGAAGSEYSWGTVRLMAMTSSGRLRFITAKLVVVLGLVAAGALLAVLVGLVYSSLITFTNGGANLDFITPTFVREQFETYGRTVFVLAPYVAMAFAGAVVGRSTLAGVGLSIGFAFMEPLIGGLMRLGGRPWEEIPRFFVNANAQVILLQNKLPEVLPHFGSTRSELAQQHLNSPEVAAIFLAVYTAIFIGLAFWVYRRRDITAA
jgi:ABC-2 type transport system permease protein